MGGCFSNERGGQQAVGGTQQAPMAAEVSDAVGYFFRSRGQYPLFSQIELSLSASKLRDRDLISKSDPLAIVYAKKKDGTLEELGRTEVIMNSLDPVWIEKTTVSYQFEILQPMVFHVYDVDTKYYNVPAKMLKLKDQQFLGEATCFLSEIVTKQNRSLALSLHRVHEHPNVNNLGTITVRAEETVSGRKSVEMTLRCSCLENKDLLSKIDPFLRISRVVEDGGFIPVCRTEVVNNNLNPTWRPLCLSMQQFGDQNTPLVIECFNFKSSGNHILIGKLQKSIAELGKLYRDKIGANFVFPSSVHHGREKVLKGQLYVENFCEKTLFSFIDYISNGFELNFMVAIDFTASNGHPQQLNSLHYIDPSGRANAYQQAIMGVGEVLQFYDSDRLFPTWGFGGRLHDGSVSHCFNLNGHSSGYEAAGMDGVMVAYANALHTFPLAGPTLFGPVINRAAQIASESCNKKYFVLLIITDGVLSDLQETIDALVKASDLPLSILIVGVGSADFKAMEILDADNGNRLESSTGRIATRDIVQFVPMREVHAGQVSVIQALLEELPGQFLTHMRSRDIKPHPVI